MINYSWQSVTLSTVKVFGGRGGHIFEVLSSVDQICINRLVHCLRDGRCALSRESV